MFGTARWLLMLCSALLARATFAQAGGRATGAAEVSFRERQLGRIFETRYAFAAVSTGANPDARGMVHAQMTFDGDEIDVHASVDCLVVVGNEAWISGPVERFLFNGVEQPQAPDAQLVLHVEDSGEGSGSPPDQASPLTIFSTFPAVCETTPGLDPLPSSKGNIQVSP
jgi:hypothetical protein